MACGDLTNGHLLEVWVKSGDEPVVHATHMLFCMWIPRIAVHCNVDIVCDQRGYDSSFRVYCQHCRFRRWRESLFIEKVIS